MNESDGADETGEFDDDAYYNRIKIELDHKAKELLAEAELLKVEGARVSSGREPHRRARDLLDQYEIHGVPPSRDLVRAVGFCLQAEEPTKKFSGRPNPEGRKRALEYVAQFDPEALPSANKLKMHAQISWQTAKNFLNEGVFLREAQAHRDQREKRAARLAEAQRKRSMLKKAQRAEWTKGLSEVVKAALKE